MRKQPKCPSTHELMNNMWCIHIMEFDSVMNRNEVLFYLTTWLNLVKVQLSKRIQSQKSTYCIILLV